MKKQKYYAVRKGKEAGIYLTWDQCKEQVHGIKGAQYKSFESRQEAENYLEGSSFSKLVHKDNIDSDHLVAYVDGSYNKEDHSFSYGVVLLGHEIEEELSERFIDPEMSLMRNVSGELYGSMKAMERALELGKKKIYIHYDYAGIEYWAKGEWKRNKAGTIRYKEYYDSIKDKIEVVFIKVPAHAGIEGNERADKLAKEAIQKEEQ